MARRLRVQYEGAIYHVTVRGVERIGRLAAKMLCKHGGKTQREVAALLGVKTGAAVCIQLRKLEVALRGDAGLRAPAAALEERLAPLHPASGGQAKQL